MQILDALGINAVAVVWHLVNFLILIVVLQRFLYRPVMRMLDERAARIRDSLAHAEAVRDETSRLQEEAGKILDEARSEGQRLREEARRAADQMLAAAQSQAREESERIIERAQADLVREREQAFLELRQEVVDLTLAAASRVLRRSLDGKAQRELIHEFLSNRGAERRPGRGERN